MNLSLVSRNDDPPDEPDPPCEVCCMETGACICPPCPYCGEVGTLACYTNERAEARIQITRPQALARIRARAAAYAEAATREGQYAEWLETTSGEISPHIEDYPITV